MNDLNYPFLTKREADQYRKEIERKTGDKYRTKKIVFTTHVYKLFPMKTLNKPVKKVNNEGQ